MFLFQKRGKQQHHWDDSLRRQGIFFTTFKPLRPFQALFFLFEATECWPRCTWCGWASFVLSVPAPVPRQSPRIPTPQGMISWMRCMTLVGWEGWCYGSLWNGGKVLVVGVQKIHRLFRLFGDCRCILLIGNLEEHDQQPAMRHTAKMVKLVAFAKSETFGLWKSTKKTHFAIITLRSF